MSLGTQLKKIENLFHYWKKTMMNLVCSYSVLYSKFKGLSRILITRHYFHFTH